MSDYDSKLIRSLAEVDWFRNAGTAEGSASSWSEAMFLATDPQSDKWFNSFWHGRKLNASNAITIRIPQDRFNCWNDIADAVRPIVDALVNEKTDTVVRMNSLPMEFAKIVNWDVSYAIILQEFADVVEPKFFDELANCYMAGHFPCGWEGEFPQGRIIVY